MDHLLTVAEAATRCAVTAKTIRRWIDANRIEYVRLPSGHYRIPSAAVDRITSPAA